MSAHPTSNTQHPTLVSGIQPTGRLHIGNYLGALKNFVDLQNSGKYECYFFIADLHSLTEEFDPKEKPKQILELTADYIALGLNPSASLGASPKKSTIFLQSLIPAHSELAWILNTLTPMGELSRMTQFRDKAGILNEEEISKPEKWDKERELLPKTHQVVQSQMKAVQKIHTYWANVGLFDYPVLMAADILLYGAQFVPVGNDQDQHLELTRTLARKFNAKFPARRSPGEGGGKTFMEPKPLHTETPRVMSLKNPGKKMSKSDPASCLFLDDSPTEIQAKIKTAVTDSGSEIKYDPKNKAAVSNLLKIYSSLADKPIEKLEKEFSGKTYSEFKTELAEVIANHFADYRTKKKTLLAKPHTIAAILKSGSQKAGTKAEKKISEVKKKIGITI